MTGRLEEAGIGKAVGAEEVPSIAALTEDCWESNQQLLENLKEDAHAAELMRLTRADAAAGRMSEPRPGDLTCVACFLLKCCNCGMCDRQLTRWI